MLKLRELMNDKPYDSKNHTLWWIEHVMRRKEVTYLHFSGADDPWYQRYDIDVVAFLSIILFTLITISIIMFVRILRWWCISKSPKKWNKVD